MTCSKCGQTFSPPARSRKGGRPRTRCDACRGNIDRIDGTRWRAIREQVLGAGQPCVRCGQPATEVDHITPLSRGGDPYDLANLQPMCKPCNVGKGTKAGAPGAAPPPARQLEPREVDDWPKSPVVREELDGNSKRVYFADGTFTRTTAMTW